MSGDRRLFRIFLLNDRAESIPFVKAMNKYLSNLAVMLASAALVTAVWDRNGNARLAAPAGRLSPQFEELQKDHLALQESNRDLRNRVALLERAEGAGAAGSIDRARLQQRLDDLETKQTGLNKSHSTSTNSA